MLGMCKAVKEADAEKRGGIMTPGELETRVRQLPHVPDKSFAHEFCALWPETVRLITGKTRWCLTRRGTFIYYSPHEPEADSGERKESRA